jgi:hypothetical protein
MEIKYFRCLECQDKRGSQRIPERILLPAYYKGKITARHCPYCRGKVKEIKEK